MSNRVVEIVERCLRETFCMTSGCEFAALAVIAALEKDGYKVMWREPTEEMGKAGFEATSEIANSQEHRWSWRVMFDAAPRYGEPSG